jgi:hypothetical protein
MDCPNCVTPWKCNGPHIVQTSSGYYSSTDGIFIKESNEWKFIPNEKSFCGHHLLDIVDILNVLNKRESKYKSQKKRLEALQKLSDLDQELGLM